MTPRLRLLLSAALGFATGILAATACAAPEPRPVELRGGVMTGPPGRALRPISLASAATSGGWARTRRRPVPIRRWSTWTWTGWRCRRCSR